MIYIAIDGMDVPMDSTSQAIDIIWKKGQSIWFVQMHVSPVPDGQDGLRKLLGAFDWQRFQKTKCFCFT